MKKIVDLKPKCFMIRVKVAIVRDDLMLGGAFRLT